ncbi:TraE/TraK family type IV conjugative transfer system protein [Hydrocarboniclastica marina]|nr:TraE/TraK family type IV conjugative transfer system protein [Hydrocarboniclastica marina]
MFKKSFNELLSDNRWLRIILAIAVLTTFIAVSGLLGKDQRIILTPVTLTDDAWVESATASENYKTAWGSFLAQLTGNLNPSSLDFVQERLEPLLAPEIYNETIKAFEAQAQDLRDNRVSMRFEIKSVNYEIATDKVFVHGYRYATASSSEKPQRSERTYEYKIRVREYTPQVFHIDTYAGKPKTQRVLRMEQMREG